MEFLILGGLVWLFIAFMNSGTENQESIQTPAKHESTLQKGDPEFKTNPPKPDRKYYWFESNDSDYEYKPWHLEFLVELDKNRGNLQKQCEEGGESLEDVLEFVKSDPVLLQSVKVIVMKYSQRRYERYFGRLESKQNVKGLPTTKESFQGDEELGLIHDVLNASPILLETEEGSVSLNKPDLRKLQKEQKNTNTEKDINRSRADYVDNDIDFLIHIIPSHLGQTIKAYNDLLEKGFPPIISQSFSGLGISYSDYTNHMLKIMRGVKSITFGFGPMMINSLPPESPIEAYGQPYLPILSEYLNIDGRRQPGVMRGDLFFFSEDMDEGSQDMIVFSPKAPGDEIILRPIYEHNVFSTSKETLANRESVYVYYSLHDNPEKWNYNELLTACHDISVHLYHLITKNPGKYHDISLSNSHLSILIGKFASGNQYHMLAALSKPNLFEISL